MAASKPSLKIRLLAALIYGLLRLIYATCRVSMLSNRSLPNEPCVVLFWHSRLAFMGFLYSLQKSLGYKKIPYVLISSHKDGLLISAVMRHFGIKTILGSSNRNPVKALINIKKILDEGNDIFITPDGPRGPAKSLSAGAINIAKRFNAKLALASNSASKVWRFNSWDKMILPKPFSKVCFSVKTEVLSEQQEIINGFNELETEQAKAGFYA